MCVIAAARTVGVVSVDMDGVGVGVGVDEGRREPFALLVVMSEAEGVEDEGLLVPVLALGGGGK